MDSINYKQILETLIENINDGILIIDSDGYPIYYNQSMETFEKTKKEDVIGRHYRKIFSHILEEESTLYAALEKGIITKNLNQTFTNLYGNETTTINTTIPVKDANKEIVAVVEIAHDLTKLNKMANRILDIQNKGNFQQNNKADFSDIHGNDIKLLQTIKLSRKAAENSAPVLIYGETGTGKELFAKNIHYTSVRRNKPFLAQNCAAIPETLLEGIFFGTSKGAFTGAVDRAGLFEQAQGGTLLLDEVSAMPIELQSKLLRVLQENSIRRIGGKTDIPIDVRIIATINESANILIETGRLRADLYYRLNIININIPPLRNRKADISHLSSHFINKYNTRLCKNIAGLSKEALALLEQYDFPGNVRELENIIYSAISLSDNISHLDVDDIAAHTMITIKETNNTFENVSLEDVSLSEYMESIEKSIIQSKLVSTQSLSKIAEELGIKRQTLQYKIKKYNLNINSID